MVLAGYKFTSCFFFFIFEIPPRTCTTFYTKIILLSSFPNVAYKTFYDTYWEEFINISICDKQLYLLEIARNLQQIIFPHEWNNSMIVSSRSLSNKSRQFTYLHQYHASTININGTVLLKTGSDDKKKKPDLKTLESYFFRSLAPQTHPIRNKRDSTEPIIHLSFHYQASVKRGISRLSVSELRM